MRIHIATQSPSTAMLIGFRTYSFQIKETAYIAKNHLSDL